MNRIYTTEGQTKAVIVTGYLGSGKTTLINRLLESDLTQQSKVAVLENEFGSVGLDGKLIKKEGIELREVAGGCVCCTQQGRMIQELSILSELGSDIVLIEATGVADPNGIAAELFEKDLHSKVSRGASICVVDAANMDYYISEDIALRQIAFADCLFITKAIPTASQLNKLRSIALYAQILYSESPSSISELVSSIKSTELPKFKIDKSESPAHGFETYTYETEVAFPIDDFRYIINFLLKQNLYYRIKGVVKCRDKPSFYFESVRYYGEEKPLSVLGMEEGSISKSELVFIGQNVDKNTIDLVLAEALCNS